MVSENNLRELELTFDDFACSSIENLSWPCHRHSLTRRRRRKAAGNAEWLRTLLGLRVDTLSELQLVVHCTAISVYACN